VGWHIKCVSFIVNLIESQVLPIWKESEFGSSYNAEVQVKITRIDFYM
jgi:hypothetical protein